MSSKPSSKSDSVTASGAAGVPARRNRTTHTKKAAAAAALDAAAIAAAGPHVHVDRDAIARLAYSYWEFRGYTYGCANEDWLRAEQELQVQ